MDEPHVCQELLHINEGQNQLAEAAYRAKVSERLAHQPRPTRFARFKSRLGWPSGTGALLVLALMTAGVAILPTRNGNRADSSSPARVYETTNARLIPASRKITAGEFMVGAKGYFAYRFSIEPDMYEPTITLRFDGAAQDTHDLTALVVDERESAQWARHDPVKILWSTGNGPINRTFEFKLPPGTYYLAVSNQFSLVDKVVSIDLELNYKSMDTRR